MRNYLPSRVPIPVAETADSKLSDILAARTPLLFVDTYDEEQFDIDLKSVLASLRKSYGELRLDWEPGEVLEFVPGVGILSFKNKNLLHSAVPSEGAEGEPDLKSFLFDTPYKPNSVFLIRGGASLFGCHPDLVNWLRLIVGNDLNDESLALKSAENPDRSTGTFRFLVVVGMNVGIPPALIPYSARIRIKGPALSTVAGSGDAYPGPSGYRPGSIEDLFWKEILDREDRDGEMFFFRAPKKSIGTVKVRKPKPQNGWVGEDKTFATTELHRFIRELAPRLAGFSSAEIRQILRYALTDTKQPTGLIKDRVFTAKRDMVERTGFLRLIDAPVKPSAYGGKASTGENPGEGGISFGGLDNVRNHLKQVSSLFAPEITPDDRKVLDGFGTKGILLVGMPGCGKSLVAKTAGDILGWPVIQLDVGRLLGKYVGESEANLRIALDIADRAAPCVMWIDELEKAFSGLDSSDGTSLRLFGSFLTWMQEKKSSVYVIATANDIDKIPPEFKRKGRFDEIFFILLPDRKEREDIFRVHLHRVAQSRKLQNSGLSVWSDIQSDNLARAAASAAQKATYRGAGTGEDAGRGFSGADIAAVVNETARAALTGEIPGGTDCFLDDLFKRIEGKLAAKTTQRDVMAGVKRPLPDGGMADGYSAAVERLVHGGFAPAAAAR